jgi:Zn-dependent oligopeptidase
MLLMLNRCSGVVSSAFQFLDDLEQRLRPVGLKEREILLALKQRECKERNLPFDGEFYFWDYRYYDRKVR